MFGPYLATLMICLFSGRSIDETPTSRLIRRNPLCRSTRCHSHAACQVVHSISFKLATAVELETRNHLESRPRLYRWEWCDATATRCLSCYYSAHAMLRAAIDSRIVTINEDIDFGCSRRCVRHVALLK